FHTGSDLEYRFIRSVGCRTRQGACAAHHFRTREPIRTGAPARQFDKQPYPPVSKAAAGARTMSKERSDALVFYGVTGDLAFKKIFPALQAMVRRGQLGVPVVGVARSKWTIDQLRQRVRDSLEQHGGVDPTAFEKLSKLLRYVSVDYADPSACSAIHNEL